jgi:hypothetical protein
VVAENANEQGRVIGRRPRGPVVEQWRDEAGMDRQHALSPALGDPQPDQPALEVDFVPVQAEQLRAAQAAVREECEQEPVALGLTGMHPAPDAIAAWHLEQTPNLAAIEDVRGRPAPRSSSSPV